MRCPRLLHLSPRFLAAALTLAAAGALPPPVIAAQAAEALQHYDIPPGPLAATLNRFAAQAGIFISGDATLTAGRQSGGLQGDYSVNDGLNRLLADTGLVASFGANGTVTLQAAPANAGALLLSPLRVGGEGETATGPIAGFAATRSSTATKTDTPLVETPQAISVVGGRQIQAQGAQRIEQVLAYTPGVVVGSYGANPEQDYVFARGFVSSYYVDGIRQYRDYITGAQIALEPYAFERVEQLRGPSSGLYGQSAPGGLTNFVSKRPLPDGVRELSLQGGSFGRAQIAADLGGALNETLAWRVTTLLRDADAQMDYQGDDRLYVAPAVTWLAGEHTWLTLYAHALRDRNALRPVSLPAEGTLLPNPNGTLPTDRFLGDPDFDRFEREQYQGGYDLEHRLTDKTLFRQKLQFTSVDQHENFTLTGYDWSFLDDQRTVDRYPWDDRNGLDVFGLDNQVLLDFGNEMNPHQLLLGLDYRRVQSDWLFLTATMAPIDAYAPVYGNAILDEFVEYIDQRQDENQIGLYLQDQLSIGAWRITTGLRYDFAGGDTRERYAATDLRQDDEALSGRAALSYVMPSGIVPYLSYATSFEPEYGLDSNGLPFEPTKGKQWEAGLKYQPESDADLFLAAAVFDLTRRNVLTPDPNPPASNPWGQIQAGEVRIRGVELEAKGALAPGLEFTAAYTWFDSEITRSNDATLGKPLFFTPKQQASFWLQYAFAGIEGLSLGAGARYRDSVWGLGYEIEVPGYTLFDAMLSYRLPATLVRSGQAELALNLRNATDKRYVANCSFYEGCYYGERGTLNASLRYSW